MLLGAGGRVERGGVRGDHALRAAVARGAQRGGHGRLLALLQPRRGLVLGQVLGGSSVVVSCDFVIKEELQTIHRHFHI